MAGKTCNKLEDYLKMNHTLTLVQKIPVPIDTAWSFFSSPANLARITPPEMMFRITGSIADENIYPGMIICYTLYPFMMLPIRWETEITVVNKPFYFEDCQKSGPYEDWHHQHFFREIDGGVEMTDLLKYSLPMGIIGEIVNTLIVSMRLEEVFNYRKKRIEELFGNI